MNPQVTLYQWPSARDTESIFPRSVVFQRICNIAGIRPKILEVTLPAFDKDFPNKLRNRLLNMPLMEVDGVRYNDSKEIIQYFQALNPGSQQSKDLNRLDVSKSFMIQQWANLVFINSLVYARWQREENFQRFSKSIRWGNVEGFDAGFAVMRSEIQKYLQRSFMSFEKEEQFSDFLAEQLLSLDILLIGQQFIEPLAEAPCLTDLYVHMVVQGLLSPDLEESVWIRARFPNVIAWFDRVDELTSKKSL